jgi:hypothetical protein
MIGVNGRLDELRDDFRATSTQSMPIAGVLFWLVAAFASTQLPPQQLAYFVGFGSGTVFPLGLLIDRLRGRRLAGDRSNPVTTLFLQCISIVAMLWPLVIIAGLGHPQVIVLGAAILMGIVWVPYGWAADDSVGLQHAIGRTLLSYAAYLFVPEPWKLTVVCLVPITAYGYSFLRMRRS